MNHNLHPVFRGLTTDEYQELTNHTRIHEKEFPKGALIFQNADLIWRLGCRDRPGSGSGWLHLGACKAG